MIMAQDANQAEPVMSNAQKSEAIKEFGRSAEVDGIKLNFILLNNKTIAALFSEKNQYAMRARANVATTFFVQGAPSTDVYFNAKFVVEQEGKEFAGEIINMKNFHAGNVFRGTQLEGLIQLGEKIDVTRPFVIKGVRDGSVEFKLSPAAIKLLAN